MNRRDLLKRAFAVGAAGLMLPVAEPVRRVWALDRTMIPRPPIGNRWFRADGNYEGPWTGVRRVAYDWNGNIVSEEWVTEFSNVRRRGEALIAYDEAGFINPGDFTMLLTRPESGLRLYNFSRD